MKPNPVHRLPAPLEAAAQSLKRAARDAVERTIESLGLAVLEAGTAVQRDRLIGAQFELNRKSALFSLAFDEAFDTRVMREAGLVAAEAAGNPPAHWDSLQLVDDREVESQIAAERFGMDVAHSCDWELREFNAYVGALLGAPAAAGERGNPLRPEVVGHALMRGIDAVTDRPELRKVLQAELGRSLGNLLRGAYAQIVADLRRAGVQPLGLTLRTTGARGSAVDGGSGTDLHGGEPAASARRSASGGLSVSGAPSGYGRYAAPGAGLPPAAHAGALGPIDPALLSVIRRLAAGPSHDSGFGEPGLGAGLHPGEPGVAPLAAPNLIRAHREELRQASRGSLDHMVIDVIGSLFDQILSDPRVPPQLAREIARLQLPVLRAALGDPSFFSSRRHPVRRFVNRVASLGAAFDDFDSAPAQRLLAQVRTLVQQIVEGDFEQLELYESKLAALEAFAAEPAGADGDAPGRAAELLAAKEDELRLRSLYAQQLQGELKGLSAPEFVSEFVAKVWSQVLLRAAERGGDDGALARRMREAGRELFVSVQPKPTPAARKTFLAELPRLMQTLTEGMDLIGWPAEQRRAFFGQLMPAHAEALKAAPTTQLDINLLARKVEGALQRPAPTRQSLPRGGAMLPVLTDEVAAVPLSAEEARAVGLVDESAVDWNTPAPPPLDIDLDALAPAGNTPPLAVPVATALPEPAEPATPTQGAALAEHLEVGFAYQMLLAGQWQKVRLTHVSPARSFFVFTHGAKQRETVSLTRRMLLRLCESGRLRAFESATLIERATARARRQLAALTARPATA